MNRNNSNGINEEFKPLDIDKRPDFEQSNPEFKDKLSESQKIELLKLYRENLRKKLLDAAIEAQLKSSGDKSKDKELQLQIAIFVQTIQNTDIILRLVKPVEDSKKA